MVADVQSCRQPARSKVEGEEALEDYGVGEVGQPAVGVKDGGIEVGMGVGEPGRTLVRLDNRPQFLEVGVDLEAVEVADDQQRRVLEVLAVVQELLVGGLQVLVLALVLPGEVAALPDVGEAVPAAGLGDALLEGVRARRSDRPRPAWARRASGTGR